MTSPPEQPAGPDRDRRPFDPTRRRLIGALGAGAGVAGAAAIWGPLPRPAHATVADLPAVTTVLVDLDTIRGRLTDRSMGFSFERNTLALPLFDDANTDLVALFRLLGPGVLRLGGNSVDRTEWDRSGSGLTPSTVSPSDLVRLRRFLDAVDWQTIYGTPFLSPGASPSSIADEVATVAVTLGSRLDGVELCNEPDLYALDPAKQSAVGTLALFSDRWDRIAAAVRTAVPGVRIVGPSDCLLQTIGGFAVPFAAAHTGELSQITQHYYRGFGGTHQTIELLLTADPAVPEALSTLAAAAANSGADGFRIDETNSFASGGQPGVSNTFAAALWAADWFGVAAGAGALGLDFHNSGAGAGYPAIVQVGGTVTQVRPLFVGLLAASSLGIGPLRPVTMGGVDRTLRVHVCSTSSTQARALLLNLGATERSVRIDLATQLDHATVSELIAPSLDATDGTTFSGAGVGIDGTWVYDPPTDVAVSGSVAVIRMRAASAMVVEIDHRPKVATERTTTVPTPSTPAPSSIAEPVPVRPRYVG